MHSLQTRFVLRYLVFVLFGIFSFPTYSQPPVQIPNIQDPSEIYPNQIDPKTLTPSQLSSLLNDKNKETKGKDKNALLDKATKLEKDSISKEIEKEKENAYNPQKTYGANIFKSAAVTNLSELSRWPHWRLIRQCPGRILIRRTWQHQVDFAEHLPNYRNARIEDWLIELHQNR